MRYVVNEAPSTRAIKGASIDEESQESSSFFRVFATIANRCSSKTHCPHHDCRCESSEFVSQADDRQTSAVPIPSRCTGAVVLTDEPDMLPYWLMASTPIIRANISADWNTIRPDMVDAVVSKISSIFVLHIRVPLRSTTQYWLDPLAKARLQLEHLTIEGVRSIRDGYVLLRQGDGFLANCDRLRSLTLSCVCLLWDSWLPPPSISSLTLEFMRYARAWRSNLPFCPEHDLGSVAPSLDRIGAYLSSPRHLVSLSLEGCFAHHGRSVVLENLPQDIQLPSLQSLKLSGDGASVDVLCRCLIIPSIQYIFMSSRCWSPIRNLHRLTQQMSHSTTAEFRLVPIVYLHTTMLRAQANSIHVDFVEASDNSVCVRLELAEYGSSPELQNSSWSDLLTRPCLPNIEQIVIHDRRAYSSGPRPPKSTSSEWRQVALIYPAISRILIDGGAEWSLGLAKLLAEENLTSFSELTEVWFSLEASLGGKEKLAFGDWITLVLPVPDLDLYFNNEPLNHDDVAAFIPELLLHYPDVGDSFSWLLAPPLH